MEPPESMKRVPGEVGWPIRVELMRSGDQITVKLGSPTPPLLFALSLLGAAFLGFAQLAIEVEYVARNSGPAGAGVALFRLGIGLLLLAGFHYFVFQHPPILRIAPAGVEAGYASIMRRGRRVPLDRVRRIRELGESRPSDRTPADGASGLLVETTGSSIPFPFESNSSERQRIIEALNEHLTLLKSAQPVTPSKRADRAPRRG